MTRDYIALAAQYQADVLSGKIPACKWVRLACERNRRDLDRQDTDGFPYRFDPVEARKICKMAEMLPHIKGPKAFVTGKDEDDRPIWNTIVLEPWQCWVLTSLFGWIHVVTGYLRFKAALALIPRKNTKSTLGAIIVLYRFVVRTVSGAECVSAATTRDQAKIVAEIVWEMARRSPKFREFFGIRLGSKTTLTLTVPETGSKFGPLSADAQTLDGLNILLALIDELHAHKTRAVMDVVDTATGAQVEPQVIAITTAGVEIGGICHEKMQYLERILDGQIVDETYWGCNWTIDPGDDIRDPIIQRKANPNYAISVQPEDLERKVAEAQHSPSALNNVLTKHFNVWIRTESAWMTGSLWQKCAKPEWEKLTAAQRYAAAIEAWKGYPCWIGVDLGEVRDPSAITLVFKLSAETYGIIPRIYWPEDGIAKSPIAILSGLARDGWIIVTPGNEADYSRMRSDLVELQALLNVQEIDFDRKSARLMMQDLRALLEPKLGRDKVERLVVDIPQSVETMDPAMKTTEGLVLGKRLQHDGNPAMAWMISNVVIERNLKGEIYPRKSGGKDSANKIDGPVAMWTALSQARIGVAPGPQFQMYVLGKKS